VPFTDWYSFRLTPLAIQCLLQGLLPREFSRHAGPDAFQLILEHAIREHREFNTPYRVVRLSFPDAQAIKAKDVRLWHLTLNLLHDVLHSALREVDVVRQETDEEFLVLLPRADDDSAAKAIDDVRSRAKAVVKVDLTLHHSFIDPVSLRTLRSGSV
jgi:GGDEF domain-containing protein